METSCLCIKVPFGDGATVCPDREALATTWACEKFSTYLIGKTFDVETDYKPLIPLLITKHLDDLPPRILRFRLRLAKFQFAAYHIPGKYMYTADALSRSPCSDQGDSELEEEVQVFVDKVTLPSLPITPKRLQQYAQAQAQDSECSQVREYCLEGCPKKSTVQGCLKPYWKVRGSLTVCDNLLLYNSRIVVPKSMQKETISRIHEGHQGVDKCRLRVQDSVWWPGVTSQVQQLRSVERAHKKHDSERNPSFQLHFQTIHGKRSQPTCSSSKVHSTSWSWITFFATKRCIS